MAAIFLNLIYFTHSLSHKSSPTVPILQSCLSLLIFKSMFKEISQCIGKWICFTLVHLIPSTTLPYPFTSHPPFCKSFPYIFLYPLLSQICFTILLMVYPSLFLSKVSYSSSNITIMFYTLVCLLSCLFLCYDHLSKVCFGVISHIWEET
jgi:hypothetical protein